MLSEGSERTRSLQRSGAGGVDGGGSGGEHSFAMDDAERRLARVEDVERIRRLDAEYCRLLDDGRWDELVALFTGDGVFDGLSRVQGHPALRAFFAGLADGGLTAFWHYVTNLEVDVDGDAARARSFLWQPCVLDGRAFVAAGRYDDRLRRVGGEWRYAVKAVRFHYFCPADEGWAPGRFALEAARAAAYVTPSSPAPG